MMIGCPPLCVCVCVWSAPPELCLAIPILVWEHVLSAATLHLRFEVLSACGRKGQWQVALALLAKLRQRGPST